MQIYKLLIAIAFFVLHVHKIYAASPVDTSSYNYWHLVALPNNADVANILGDNVLVTWQYNEENQTWSLNTSRSDISFFSSFSTFTTADNTKGYWILSSKADPNTFISYSVNDNQNDINLTALSKGWHLISSKAYPDISQKYNTRSIKGVWSYTQSEGWSLYMSQKANTSFVNGTYPTLSSISATQGYWIYKQTVDNNAPSSSLLVDNTSPYKQEIISFSANGADADGDMMSYTWDFGDGNSSTEQNPSYSYSEAGDYSVTLKVTDSEGATTIKNVNISVQDMFPDPMMFSSSDFPCNVIIEDSGDKAVVNISYVNASKLLFDMSFAMSMQGLRNEGLSINDMSFNLNSSYLEWNGNAYTFTLSGNNMQFLSYADTYGTIQASMSKFKFYGEYYPYSDKSFSKSVALSYMTINYYGIQDTQYLIRANNNEYQTYSVYQDYYDNFDTKFSALNLIADDNVSNTTTTQTVSGTCQDELVRLLTE